jgi:hypothetical protein
MDFSPKELLRHAVPYRRRNLNQLSRHPLGSRELVQTGRNWQGLYLSATKYIFL